MIRKNIAIILAAGSGERSGFDIPKQLVKIAGKPVIQHTISTFQNAPDIDEIIIVTNKNCITPIKDIVANSSLSKVKKIIYGGKERYQSSLSAINECGQDAALYNTKLIFHDAVRALVSERIIRDVVKALDEYNAVDVVVPTTDTIIIADPVFNTISSIPDREKLMNAQTPQGFRWNTIRLAYDLALKDTDFKTTDDCGVVFKYLPGEKIYLVTGDRINIKLTYKSDLQIIENLFNSNSNNN